MAKPKDPIYVWAAANVNLPGTGRPNKSKPIDDLLAKGYDKGQKPAAEEFNYILNMSSGWINWIVNEKFPELEAEISRQLADLENRINVQISSLKQDMATLKQDVADLKRYVDQQVKTLKDQIDTVQSNVTQLRQDFDVAVGQINGRIDDLEPRLVPIGAIIPWPGQTPPPGWLECNGQLFNTGTNPKLYNVLGTNSVPDYRGIFLRGWAHGSGAYDPDAGRALGSVQGDALAAHEHRLQMAYENGDVPAGSEVVAVNQPSGRVGYELPGANKNDNAIIKLPTSVSKALADGGGPETRPKNIAVMYVIKTDLAQSTGSNSPTGVVVSPDTISQPVGYTTRATATVMPTSLAGQYPVTWTSQNPAVATVDGSGNIRVNGPGTTNILASISTGLYSSIRVTGYSLLTSISLGAVDPIQVGSSSTLPVSRTPTDANEPLQFLSNNSGVAIVDNNGTVSGISPGTVTITVRGTLSGVSSTRTVTVIPEEVDQTIEDIQLGAAQTTTAGTIPAGCVLVMVTGTASASDLDFTYRYKPIQKKINGVFVTIAG